jgi:hypothetical protein
MERNINYPKNKFKIINEYNYQLIDEDDDEIDLDMEDGKDIDAELGLDDQNTEDVEGSSDEVEIDVTDIVSKQDEILAKFDEMIASINGIKANDDTEEMKKSIANISNKIEGGVNELKKELIKRNPTPNEKLQLQSMNSFPYNLSLSDYWEPAEDENEEEIAMSGSGDKNFIDKTLEDDEPSYDLSVKDIEDDYSEVDVRNSLNI